MNRRYIKSSDRHEISYIIDKPNCNRKGIVILCHGITVDKYEKGKFTLLSEKLVSSGFEVLRFDFRGHGESNFSSQDMTISGQLLDLESMVNEFYSNHSSINVLGSSFGAGATILYASKNIERINSMVLWNPVIDYEKTFLDSITPWGNTIFDESFNKRLIKNKFIKIPNTDFKLGAKLIAEFETIKPYEELEKFKFPILTLHGTHDTKVPYDVSKRYSTPNSKSKFIPINSNHGFGDHKEFVYEETVKWFNLNCRVDE